MPELAVKPGVGGDDDPVYLFDLDGTLLRCEILPMLANEVGMGREMSALTRRTMAGDVPFDESFRQRVAMLSGVPIERAVEVVLQAPVLEGLLDWIRAKASQCYVLTSNLDCWVKPWLDQHGLRGFTSTAVSTESGPRVSTILRKDEVVASFGRRPTVVIGDGANDAEAMRVATFAVGCGVVNPIPRVVIDVADYLAFEEAALCRLMSRL